MRTLVFSALLAVSPAFADLVVKNDRGDYMRLSSNAPCKHEGILSAIKPEYHDQFKAGEAYIARQSRAACWIVEDDVVTVFFEDGGGASYPLGIFKEAGV